jgi:hypothetical protein
MRHFYYYFLLLPTCLIACAMPVEMGPDLETTSSRFSEAMRWRDFAGAANFLEPGVRAVFLRQFQDDNLHVIESRIISVQLAENGESATADYLLEYYLLPSNRIKKWHWQQQWQLPGSKGMKSRYWMIQNDPPAFP